MFVFLFIYENKKGTVAATVILKNKNKTEIIIIILITIIYI